MNTHTVILVTCYWIITSLRTYVSKYTYQFSSVFLFPQLSLQHTQWFSCFLKKKYVDWWIWLQYKILWCKCFGDFVVVIDNFFFCFVSVENLIYWRDPKKTGPIFGGVLIVLLALTYFSFISVAAYLSLFALTGTISFRIYKNIVQAVQKTGDGHPFK